MAAGKIQLQSADSRIATVTFEDGAAGNVNVVVPKEGGTLASEAYVASQIGAIPVVGNASQTVKGIIEIATNAEVQTGTDTVRAVTPAGLKDSLPSLIAGATNSGIGDFALCKSDVVVSYGATVAGSTLVTTGFYTSYDADGSWTITNGSSLSGTWKCKGTIGSGRGLTLFQRIA